MIIRLSLLTLLLGCRNECQQICTDMAKYAEDDCGETVDKEQINTCMADYRRRNLSAEQLDACAEYGDRIEEEWTCDDLAEYFDGK